MALFEYNKTPLTFFTDENSFGGHELMTLSIFRELTKFRETNLVVHKNNHALINEVCGKIKANLKLHDAPSIKKKRAISSIFAAVKARIALAQTLNKSEVVILCAGDIGSCINGFLMTCFRKNCKIYWYFPMVRPFTGLLNTIVFKILIKLVRSACTVTDYQRSVLKNLNPKANVTTVENFICDIRIRRLNQTRNSRAKKRKGVYLKNSAKISLGLIGRPHWQKGFDLFFDACALIEKSEPDVAKKIEIHVFGCDRSDVAAQLTQHLGIIAIKFHGWQQYPFDEYLDSIIMPSRYEGDPLLIHEARICGIPIFVNDLKELSDVLLDHEKIKFARTKYALQEVITKTLTINWDDLEQIAFVELMLQKQKKKNTVEFFSGI